MRPYQMSHDESYLYDEPYDVVFGRNIDLWIKRVLIYLFLYSLVLGASSRMSFMLSLTSTESARLVVGTLVTTEAAIIAVVVSLSLMGATLVAASYSSRAIDLFKNYPDFWIIMAIYIYSICYGLCVLKMITDEDDSSIEGSITAAIQLGMFALIAIALYIYSVVDLLNPSKIVQILSQKIEVDSVLSSKRLGDKDDPFQPIIDIAISSMNKYDEGTLADVLDAIGSRKKTLFYNGSWHEKEIGSRLFEHLLGLGKLAAERKDEYAANLVIDEIAQIGVYVAENQIKTSADEAAKTLGLMGEKAVENRLERAAIKTAVSLGIMGEMAAQNKLDEAASLAARSIRLMGERAAENKLEKAADQVAISIGQVGIKAAENRLERATYQVAYSLGVVGEKAADNELKWTPFLAAKYLGLIGGKSADNGLDETVDLVAYSLGLVGEKAAENGLDEAAGQAAYSLGLVGVKAAENELPEAIGEATKSLGLVGVKAAQNKLKAVANQVSKSLGLINERAAENYFDDVS